MSSHNRRSARRSLLHTLAAGRRAAAVAVTWVLRLSGVVAVVVLFAVLFYPRSVPDERLPELDPAVPSRSTAVSAPAIAPPGVCTDPAISGCDSYGACVAAVTIGSGLAPDPRRSLAQGLESCAEGSQ